MIWIISQSYSNHEFFVKLNFAMLQVLVRQRNKYRKGQSKVYFITWPVQNATGQLLLLSLSEIGKNFFEANINGTETFYELKMKFEM